MNSSSEILASLIDEHLAGRAVHVPPELQAEFEQAAAAHAALCGMLDATFVINPSEQKRLPPNVCEKYEIERELGHGGMGVVYLARQRSLNRRVALKVLRPGEQTFGPLVRRFLDEAQHLAQLRHPNIVSIHEVGDAGGEPYFTMDFIDGETLAALMARCPLTPTRAVEVLKQVAAAIQHAHRNGIIHRDLKPGNVLLDHAGQVFVTDFGLARNVSQDSGLTQSGELLGTPQYMAPEQARGQVSLIGEATDIHALGLLLFEMLSGRVAFGGSSPADVLVKLLNEDPPPLRSIDRRIPRDLETICMKMLQKSSADRYPNVSALLEDIRRFEAGEPLLARRTSVLTRAVRWSFRHWRTAATVLITAVLVGAITPLLLDKSVDDLIKWGNEELRNERPEIAIEIFQRAWSSGDATRRTEIAPRIIEAIRETADSQLAVDAALKVIEFAPEATFGRHDFLVAQSLAMAARAETQNGEFEPLHPSASPIQILNRELAARRLTLFLEGASGTQEERAEAEQTLLAIDRSLRTVRPTERWSTDDIVRLPDGNPEDLARRSADLTRSPWERGKAAFALGRVFESRNDSTQALSKYRVALNELRRVYPFVSGVVSDTQIHADGTNTAQAEAPECRLMRELLESLHRLDPEFSETVTGGFRLQFDHPEVLDGVHVSARLLLCDESVADPHEGLIRNLSTSVPLSTDTPREVHVMPGRYRLALSGTSFKWVPTPAIKPSLLDISAANWPATIEISGDVIDLPPLKVRKLVEIKVSRPAPFASLNLRTDSIEWTSVEGAAKYEVTLGHFSDVPHPSATWFQTVTVETPSLNCSHLSDRDRSTLSQHWQTGRTVGIRIQAFNDEGQRIAVSIEGRRFLIATSLNAR